MVGARIDLLIDRARAGECDLVIKGGGNHGEKGYLYDVGSGLFLGNRRSDAPISDATLRQRAQKDGELTYTCTRRESVLALGCSWSHLVACRFHLRAGGRRFFKSQL